MGFVSRILVLVAWLMAISPMMGATIRLAGYGTDGKVMANGSGCAIGDGLERYFHSQVSDDGAVLFIAPMPGVGEVNGRFWAVYRVNSLAAKPAAEMIFTGQKQLFSIIQRNTHLAVAADEGLDGCGGLFEQGFGASTEIGGTLFLQVQEKPPAYWPAAV